MKSRYALRDMWTMDVLVFPTYCELLMFPKMRRISITSFVSIVHPVKFDNPWTFFRNKLAKLEDAIAISNLTDWLTGEGFDCHWQPDSWPKRFLFHNATTLACCKLLGEMKENWKEETCSSQIVNPKFQMRKEEWNKTPLLCHLAGPVMHWVGG